MATERKSSQRDNTVARVVPQKLSDGSKVYDVHLFDTEGKKLAVISAVTAGHADLLATALNQATDVVRS
jgi:hypothetical protein